MKLGDFSALAKDYINRPGYSELILKMLATWVGAYSDQSFQIADVGAGTGKLTEQLVEMGFNVWAVEPNDEMRAEGERLVKGSNLTWSKGSGEATGLESGSVDWVIMASSFHWVDFEKGLQEFYRILRPNGIFTAIWNPRDIERSELHTKIENIVYTTCPGIKRVSSGSSEFTKTLLNRLNTSKLFKEAFFVEACDDISMSKERYMGAWRSVNDIQVQAGPAGFMQILEAIEKELSSVDEVSVPYKTRAWTVRKA